ncbi:FIT family protein CG10671-like isoform X2 [Varroa jacobsoni]|uniref:FIT family protein n=1 Tax=Varroa destructor TaxID=109461 RepID=A0A7M7K260_VARDE|nr:FIT family protein CG10671-like isoform X2 [Varroa destructor]XP_022685906.1 FIT family protein CG10671-like isoform X2 [Varroa jacobsoni]
MPPKLVPRNGDRKAASLKWDSTRKASVVASTGRRPLPEPMTIGNTILMVILHVCRRAVLIDAKYKRRIMRHLLRMVVGTAVWFLFTNFFVYVESKTGSCSGGKITSRTTCLNKGHKWIGFDISGHCFLLIFCHLLISEELRTLFNWERIADIIRNEQFDDDSPMKSLTEEQKQALRENYPKYTPYIRVLFIALTVLAVLWDVMLVSTVLYFHTMVQKMAGGVLAVLCWYFIYRFWYPSLILPPMPGVGLIRYSEGYRRA